MCLSNCQEILPDWSVLQLAGLGETRLSLSAYADAQEIQDIFLVGICKTSGLHFQHSVFQFVEKLTKTDYAILKQIMP